MKTTISILIPVYNAEKTIKRTLDSILNQTCLPFEVVLLNDGSSDSSLKILEEYQKENNLFEVYTQQNCGVAITRQNLIEKASGEYLPFCDADDYYEKNTIEQILNVLEKKEVDLIDYGYTLIKKSGNKTILKRQLSEGMHSKSEYGLFHIKGLTDLYYSFLCNKCLKKELIMMNPSLKFQHTMEDVIFNIEYMERCNSIYILEKSLYIHDQTGDSLTRGEKKDSVQNIMDAYETFQYSYNKLKKTYPEYLKNISEYIYQMLISLCDRAKKINEDDTYTYIKNSDFLIQVKNNLGFDGRVAVSYKKFVSNLKQNVKKIMFK